ncbi:alpha/beta fold hydrolase [Nocardia ignorata]|uniref:Pimeloyl-ACP methyl ester carboxylesterase n=1 Tax=Nocardia ignorata TaxID=145285 RepID=A0A4R6PIF5_NOCIG|nr:alpha/beta hydrolase [Nocardia ignorata]TDP38138.1 pimeloyl-ACP methyl ester carboxylesterase [Nocardia ignorata]
MNADRPPLVLLHGLTMSERAWAEVVPLLAPHHHVITPTLLGHRDGPKPTQRPTRVSHLVDDIEALLDTRGLHQVHLAGNSLGGWIAIELARRGRARSVCALSPAGFWEPRRASQTHGTSIIAREAATARLGRPLAPLGLWSPLIRRLALRNIATRGDRISSAQALDIVHDLTECPVTTDLLSTDEYIAPLPDLPCPMTVAWAEHDRLLPLAVNTPIARLRLSAQTHFRVLRGVGHVPMIDDPELVARTILATTAGHPQPEDSQAEGLGH